MRVFDWLARFFTPDKQEIDIKQTAPYSAADRLLIERFAVSAAINLIAGTVSRCEFRTFLEGKENRSATYFQLNLEPNQNQSGPEFWQEAVTTLLYDNECLIVEQAGSLLVADSFSREENTAAGDAFRNVAVKELTLNGPFYAEDVIYLRYSNDETQRMLSLLVSGLEELASLAWGKYRRSGGRKGILRINKSDEGDEKYKAFLDNLTNKLFHTYFTAENAALPLPKGFEYEEKGDSSKYNTGQVSDVTMLLQECMIRAAQAFRIPPALLLGQAADLDSAVQNFLSFCVGPLCELIEAELNRKLYGCKAVQNGHYVRVDAGRLLYRDPFTVSAQADKLISSGLYSIDELRRRMRETELGTDWSRRHWMTKNYTDIEAIEDNKKEVKQDEPDQESGQR